jgi:hypothetical protein
VAAGMQHASVLGKHAQHHVCLHEAPWLVCCLHVPVNVLTCKGSFACGHVCLWPKPGKSKPLSQVVPKLGQAVPPNSCAVAQSFSSSSRGCSMHSS